VVLFSEGFCIPTMPNRKMEAVADAANRANVSIYVIDPEGIEINPYGAGGRPTDNHGPRAWLLLAPLAQTSGNAGETKLTG